MAFDFLSPPPNQSSVVLVVDLVTIRVNISVSVVLMPSPYIEHQGSVLVSFTYQTVTDRDLESDFYYETCEVILIFYVFCLSSTINGNHGSWTNSDDVNQNQNNAARRINDQNKRAHKEAKSWRYSNGSCHKSKTCESHIHEERCVISEAPVITPLEEVVRVPIRGKLLYIHLPYVFKLTCFQKIYNVILRFLDLFCVYYYLYLYFFECSPYYGPRQISNVNYPLHYSLGYRYSIDFEYYQEDYDNLMNKAIMRVSDKMLTVLQLICVKDLKILNHLYSYQLSLFVSQELQRRHLDSSLAGSNGAYIPTSSLNSIAPPTRLY
jgi:hypothetical protein